MSITYVLYANYLVFYLIIPYRIIDDDGLFKDEKLLLTRFFHGTDLICIISITIVMLVIMLQK